MCKNVQFHCYKHNDIGDWKICNISEMLNGFQDL